LRRIDRHCRRRQAATGEHLREQPTEGVPDQRWFLAQLPDQLSGVVDDLTHRLVGEALRVRPCLVDGLRVVRPRWR
jgi:hypothetical protein